MFRTVNLVTAILSYSYKEKKKKKKKKKGGGFFVVVVMRTLRIYSFKNFQIYHTGAWSSCCTLHL